jgi:threonine dehydratase
MHHPSLPTCADVEAAAARIAPHAAVTPLLRSPALDAVAGGPVLLKAEVLQHTGSFKLRGALNRLLQLSAEERTRGVVAYSSGNHAQAVAYAATLLGMPSVIVMPKDAPPLKIERTRGFGGEVVLYDRYTEDRVAIGGAIARERGMVVVPPFEDAHVIAGQGTLALEALRQAQALGLTPNRLLVCCGGGGLTAGCALAAEGVSPSTVVHPVEPVGFDDYARSLAGGVRVGNPPGNRSVCDAIVTEMPGEMTFAITQPRVGAGLTVSDDEALAAVAFAVRELKLVVEPGGAVALAALLAGRVGTRGEVTMAVVTGGNIDPGILGRAITDPELPRFVPRG